MFIGIDEVDWASMEHAYGSAEDVPMLLRGLVSRLPDERERALDGMYGAVHHQGDVYDSTLACIPFLFDVMGRTGLPDRGSVVELLASIGGTDLEDEDFPDDTDADRPDNYAMARAAVRAGAETFFGLTEDADPQVRRAAAHAVVRFADGPARVFAVLRRRVEREADGSVQTALIEALGCFARLHPRSPLPAVDLLHELYGTLTDPGLRLAALGQLAGRAPERLPKDLVPTVVALLRERSRVPRAPRTDDRPETDTLVGRRLRPADQEGSRLLRTLHAALGGRTVDRIALLSGQLTSPDVADRCNAVWMSAGLFREWRGAYEEPVALIGDQLAADDARLREAAVSVLEDLFELAAPAADRLAALVAADPECWVRRWEHGAPTLGGPLRALARTGDPRAIPALAAVLGQETVPHDLGYVVAHLGPEAAGLAGPLRARLRCVPPDSPDVCGHAGTTLHALALLRDPAALPDVLRLLHEVPGDLPRREALTESAVRVLDALAAPEAIPVLRGLLDGECAVPAAAALWSAEGDPEAVLPVLGRELGSGRPHRRRAAAETLGRMGAQARSLVPELSVMTRSDEVWQRTAAACALWRVTGDPDPVLPVLRAAWEENLYTRGTIAECLAGMGRAGEPVHDLLRTEVAAPRRHRARTGGYGSHDVLEDERLLRVCREALSADQVLRSKHC
ncbi:HEAT repeat domain-containing protein [Streptomyces sp. NPDC005731]|uniref:HEAT repeat domain-containing protein n=1 Tax=unclassified Streptomyces TaxID=2593676 RepID=UPI00340DF9E2